MLIGITGKAFCGKDSVANIIKAQDKRFLKYSFAAPIKSVCKDLFEWDESHVNGDLKEVVDPFWGVSPRYAMQKFGTEFGRDLINKNMWVMKAQKVLDKHKFVVVPDVRFPNEVAWIRQNNGLLIKVERPGAETTALNQHASEMGIGDEFGKVPTDTIIVNDGDLSHLTKVVVTILENCKNGR